MLGALFDRDYRPSEEAAEVQRDLTDHIALAHVHERKELENYLLVPAALQRALDSELRARPDASGSVDVTEVLLTVTEEFKAAVQAQLYARRKEWLGKSSKDESTIFQEFMAWFNAAWANTDQRLKLVPGKDCLRRLREHLQVNCGVNLTDNRIVDGFRSDTIPADLVGFLERLDAFRSLTLPMEAA